MSTRDSTALVCNHPACGFSSPVQLEKLSFESAQLLVSWLDPHFEATPDQVEAIGRLITGELECPEHGRENLGYGSISTTSIRIEIQPQTKEFEVWLENSHFE